MAPWAPLATATRGSKCIEPNGTDNEFSGLIMSPWEGEGDTPFHSVGQPPPGPRSTEMRSLYLSMALRPPHHLPDFLPPWSPSTHHPLQPGAAPGPPYLGHT